MSFVRLEPETVHQSVVYPTQYVAAISLAILLYDFSLTFCNEVNWIWPNGSTNKPTIITILFFFHRYFSILVAPVLVVQYFWENSDPSRITTCKALTSFHHVTIFVSQALMGAILIMRTYALYNKNRYILIFLCSIASAVVGSAIWALVEAPTIAFRENELPRRGCILPISRQSIESYMPAVLLGMSGEVVVFTLTLYKSIQIIKTQNSVVLRILLRDGALYFGIVMVANIAVLVSYYVFEDYSRGNIATLTNSIYSTLVSRLILNLRDPSLSSDRRFRTHYQCNQTETSDIFTLVVDSESYDESSYGCADSGVTDKMSDRSLPFGSVGPWISDSRGIGTV